MEKTSRPETEALIEGELVENSSETFGAKSSQEVKQDSDNSAEEKASTVGSSLAFRKHGKPEDKTSFEDSEMSKASELGSDSPVSTQVKANRKQDAHMLKKSENQQAETDLHDSGAADQNTRQTTQAKAPPKKSGWGSVFAFIALGLSSVALVLAWQNGQKMDQMQHDLNLVQTKQSKLSTTQDSVLATLPESVLSQEQFTQSMQTLSSELESRWQERLQAVVAQTQQSEQAQTDEAVNQIQQTLVTQMMDERLMQLQQQLREEMQSKLNTAISTLELPSMVVESQGEAGLGSQEVVLQKMTQKMALLEQSLQDVQMAITEPASDVKHSDVVVAKSVIPFSTLQQWILEANTQWLLGASPSATLQKLNAIEQAAIASGYAQISKLSRLIGEDSAYLKRYQARQNPGQESGQTGGLPSLSALKQAVDGILPPDPAIELSPTPSPNPEVMVDAQTVSEQTAWARLLERLSEMVTIKNRSVTGEPTSVEALLQHDILKQRLMLLIERMEWAAEYESMARYHASIKAIEVFVSQYFERYSPQFQSLLAPFKAFERQERAALATASIQDS